MAARPGRHGAPPVTLLTHRPKSPTVARLLHLSDLHFGAEDPRAVEAVLALAQALAPQLIAITGDLTQRATLAQFAAYRRFAERLPAVPCLVVPGNHDLPWWPLTQRVSQPHGRFLHATGQASTQPSAQVGPLQLRLVDSTRWWRHQYGALSAAQVAQVAQVAQAAQTAQMAHVAGPAVGPPAVPACAARPWRLVATHHPLRLANPRHPRANPADRPWGHARALAAWADAGVDLVLTGHVHLPALLPPEPGRPGPWIVQAGSATSWRLPPGQANSVALLDALAADRSQAKALGLPADARVVAPPDRLHWTRYDLAAGARAFEPVAERLIVRTGTGRPSGCALR